MHIIQTQQQVKRPIRKVYLPHERVIVTADGLGEVGGFNIGKMFSRMTHFTPKSFRPKNIMHAVGSFVASAATLGLGPTLAPKEFSANTGKIAHITGALVMPGGAVGVFVAPRAYGLDKKEARIARMVVGAAAAVAGGVFLAPMLAPAIASIGPALSSAASMLGTSAGSLLSGGASLFGKFFGGLSGRQQQQVASSISPQDIVGIERGQIDPNLYMQSLQSQLPSPMVPSIPGESAMSYGSAVSPDMQPVGPYSSLTDVGSETNDGTQIGIGPDGKPVITLPKDFQTSEASMFPGMSNQTLLWIGGLSAVGLVWYLMENKK